MLAYPNHPTSGTPPRKKEAFKRSPPKRNIQNVKAFKRGKATSLAPIISGIMKLKNAAFNGIKNKKTIVVPCMVNISLNFIPTRKSFMG